MFYCVKINLYQIIVDFFLCFRLLVIKSTEKGILHVLKNMHYLTLRKDLYFLSCPKKRENVALQLYFWNRF